MKSFPMPLTPYSQDMKVDDNFKNNFTLDLFCEVIFRSALHTSNTSVLIDLYKCVTIWDLDSDF